MPGSESQLDVKIVMLVCDICSTASIQGPFYLGVKVPGIELHCSLTLSFLVVSQKSHYWLSSEPNGVISIANWLHIFTC